MGLQYVLSIFGRTLSDRPLSSAWRMTLVLYRTRRANSRSPHSFPLARVR